MLGAEHGVLEAMSEADRLLHNILEGGDIVGKDAADRVVIQVAVDRRDFEALMTFGTVEVESEDGDRADVRIPLALVATGLKLSAKLLRLADTVIQD